MRSIKIDFVCKFTCYSGGSKKHVCKIFSFSSSSLFFFSVHRNGINQTNESTNEERSTHRNGINQTNESSNEERSTHRNGINQTSDTINEERPCTTIH